VRQSVKIIGKTGDRREAAHHQEQREGGKLAVGEQAGCLGGESAHGWRNADEQGGPHDADDAGHRRQWHEQQHEYPQDHERDDNRCSGIARGPA
jgi:hypothetical protein